MHVMTKYLDTRKAAIAALQDYAVMEQIIESTDEQIKAAYADAASPASPRMDGTPPSGDLHASENRIVASIERIDAYKARYLQAGFCLRGKSSLKTTASSSKASSSARGRKMRRCR